MSVWASEHSFEDGATITEKDYLRHHVAVDETWIPHNTP